MTAGAPGHWKKNPLIASPKLNENWFVKLPGSRKVTRVKVVEERGEVIRLQDEKNDLSRFGLVTLAYPEWYVTDEVNFIQIDNTPEPPPVIGSASDYSDVTFR